MRRIAVGLRLLILGLCSLIIIPLQLLALRFGWPILHRLPIAFHRLFLRLFGVRVTERGTPPGDVATLVLSKHLSWLDIPVIGSLHPVSFIAKSEVESWPLVGLLARLQRSCSSTASAASRPPRSTTHWRIVLARARSSCSSPKARPATATGSCRPLLAGWCRPGGARARSFERVFLQPLAIAYTRRNGMPVTRRERPFSPGTATWN